MSEAESEPPGHQRGLDSTLSARDASKACTLLTPALQTAKEQTLQEQKWNEAALKRWQGSHTLEAKVSVCQESRPSEKEQREERGLKDRAVFVFSMERIFSI